MGRITLKDVAKEAGVSLGMASRVLGNHGYYSQETKKKVLEAAKRLNYKKNLIASALKNKKTKVIGVLVSNIASFYWSTIVRAIEDIAHKSGYHVIVCNTDENPEKAKEYIRTLEERNIDGLIVSPSPKIYSELKNLHISEMPLVLVDRAIKGLKVPTFIIDNETGAYDAVSFLIKQGHKRIAIITGLKGIMTTEERLQGYLKAMKKNDLPIDKSLIREGNFKKDIAYKVTRELMSMKNPPTAIFISNETMTLGTLLSLKDMKINISRDVKIVGFGDPDWASLITPPITTISQPSLAIGTLAGETLLKIINGNLQLESEEHNIILKPELKIRERDTIIRF